MHSQIRREPVWTSYYNGYGMNVPDYVYDHFEIGGGGHIFILVPGGHAKLRYAPINYQRIKLMGEIRGELVLAPLAGWNYNIQLGTGFQNDVGVHAGIGRSHYVARAIVDSVAAQTNHLFQNSIEFGVRWESKRYQFDLWANIPLYTKHIPVFAVGISITSGGLWDFKDQKWFLPQRE